MSQRPVCGFLWKNLAMVKMKLKPQHEKKKKIIIIIITKELRNVAISSFPSPKAFLLFPALFLFPARKAHLSHQSIQQANLAHWILWCDISIFFIFFAGCALFASCTFCVVCAFIARLRSSIGPLTFDKIPLWLNLTKVNDSQNFKQYSNINK